MLNSYELIGFLSRDLSHTILGDTAEDNPELYQATLAGISKLRGIRPQYIKRQRPDARHQFLLESLSRPALEETTSQLISGWLIKHQADLLKSFLEALKVEHDDGVVDDLPESIADDVLSAAVDQLLANHEREIVILYLHAFHAMNGAGWPNLESALENDERLQFV